MAINYSEFTISVLYLEPSFVFTKKMKKIILIFLSFSFCNHNPTRSEIETGKNKWKRPKKTPPSDTVQMSAK